MYHWESNGGDDKNWNNNSWRSGQWKDHGENDNNKYHQNWESHQNWERSSPSRWDAEKYSGWKEEAPKMEVIMKHFDFIEVGTASWGTITHYCAAKDDEKGSWSGAEIWTCLDDLSWARGLAVDPIKDNLDNLPRLPQVDKIEAAMDEFSRSEWFYYVSPDNVKKYTGKYTAYFSEDKWAWPVDVMWYATALGSLGKPHENLVYMLKQIGHSDLLERKSVQVFDWQKLCIENGVRSVDVVQLDCEGKDCAILRGMVRYCDTNPRAFPRVVTFEANHLTPDSEIEAVLELLEKRGYRIKTRSQSNITVLRDFRPDMVSADTAGSAGTPTTASSASWSDPGPPLQRGSEWWK